MPTLAWFLRSRRPSLFVQGLVSGEVWVAAIGFLASSRIDVANGGGMGLGVDGLEQSCL